MKYIKHLHFLSILCSIMVFTKCGEDDENTVSDDTKDTVSDDTNTVPDTDGYSVADVDETCPNTVESVEVNKNGFTHSQLANLSGYN